MRFFRNILLCIILELFVTAIQIANMFLSNVAIYEATTGVTFDFSLLLKNVFFWIVLILQLAYAVFCMIIKIFSQNADSVTAMIETEKVSFSQVAYFAATYLEFLPDIASEQEAMNAISLRGISSIPDNPYEQISYQKFAQICMNTWIKKGGLLYW